MLRKILASVAAVAVFAATLGPVDASAQRHGYYESNRHNNYGRRSHYRGNGDAVAAGVVGLIIGAAIGSMSNQPRDPRLQCNSNYQRCPSQPYYGGANQGSYDPRYDNRNGSSYDPRYDNQSGAAYDPRYDDRSGSAYESDYGPSQGAYDQTRPCLRREERWDAASGGYITVDTPC